MHSRCTILGFIIDNSHPPCGVAPPSFVQAPPSTLVISFNRSTALLSGPQQRSELSKHRCLAIMNLQHRHLNAFPSWYSYPADRRLFNAPPQGFRHLDSCLAGSQLLLKWMLGPHTISPPRHPPLGYGLPQLLARMAVLEI